MKRSRLLLIAVAVVLVVAASVATTLAYFTANDKAENKVTLGVVDIEIIESNWDTTNPPIVVPGEPCDKNPKVENTSNVDAYIRVQVAIPTFTYNGAPTPLYTLNGIDTANWNYDDGYYYYTSTNADGSVAPSGFTTELFQSFTLNPDFKEDDYASLAKDFDGNPITSIIVYAEAIQAGGFSDMTVAWAAYTTQNSSNP